MEKLSNIQAIEFAQKVAEMGVERVVYTDIARDGMLTGVNVAATRAIAEVSGLKITASGGVASLDDVYAVKELEEYGVDSLIIGKASTRESSRSKRRSTRRTTTTMSGICHMSSVICHLSLPGPIFFNDK